MPRTDYPRIAILGAGPIGLEAALEAATRRLPARPATRFGCRTGCRTWQPGCRRAPRVPCSAGWTLLATRRAGRQSGCWLSRVSA